MVRSDSSDDEVIPATIPSCEDKSKKSISNYLNNRDSFRPQENKPKNSLSCPIPAGKRRRSSSEERSPAPPKKLKRNRSEDQTELLKYQHKEINISFTEKASVEQIEDDRVTEQLTTSNRGSSLLSPLPVTPPKMSRSGRRIVAPNKGMPEPMTPPGPSSTKKRFLSPKSPRSSASSQGDSDSPSIKDSSHTPAKKCLQKKITDMINVTNDRSKVGDKTSPTEMLTTPKETSVASSKKNGSQKDKTVEIVLSGDSNVENLSSEVEKENKSEEVKQVLEVRALTDNITVQESVQLCQNKAPASMNEQEFSNRNLTEEPLRGHNKRGRRRGRGRGRGSRWIVRNDFRKKNENLSPVVVLTLPKETFAKSSNENYVQKEKAMEIVLSGSSIAEDVSSEMSRLEAVQVMEGRGETDSPTAQESVQLCQDIALEDIGTHQQDGVIDPKLHEKTLVVDYKKPGEIEMSDKAKSSRVRRRVCEDQVLAASHVEAEGKSLRTRSLSKKKLAEEVTREEHAGLKAGKKLEAKDKGEMLRVTSEDEACKEPVKKKRNLRGAAKDKVTEISVERQTTTPTALEIMSTPEVTALEVMSTPEVTTTPTALEVILTPAVTVTPKVTEVTATDKVTEISPTPEVIPAAATPTTEVTEVAATQEEVIEEDKMTAHQITEAQTVTVEDMGVTEFKAAIKEEKEEMPQLCPGERQEGSNTDAVENVMTAESHSIASRPEGEECPPALVNVSSCKDNLAVPTEVEVSAEGKEYHASTGEDVQEEASLNYQECGEGDVDVDDIAESNVSTKCGGEGEVVDNAAEGVDAEQEGQAVAQKNECVDSVCNVDLVVKPNLKHLEAVVPVTVEEESGTGGVILEGMGEVEEEDLYQRIMARCNVTEEKREMVKACDPDDAGVVEKEDCQSQKAAAAHPTETDQGATSGLNTSQDLNVVPSENTECVECDTAGDAAVNLVDSKAKQEDAPKRYVFPGDTLAKGKKAGKNIEGRNTALDGMAREKGSSVEEESMGIVEGGLGWEEAGMGSEEGSPERPRRLDSAVSTPERAKRKKHSLAGSRAAMLVACAKKNFKNRGAGDNEVLAVAAAAAAGEGGRRSTVGSSPFTATVPRTLSPGCRGVDRPWVKHHPSPGASPSSSILKTDTPGSDGGSPKLRRVSFADPPVSHSVVIPRSPRSPRRSWMLAPRAQKRLDMTHASSPVKDKECWTTGQQEAAEEPPRDDKENLSPNLQEEEVALSTQPAEDPPLSPMEEDIVEHVDLPAEEPNTDALQEVEGDPGTSNTTTTQDEGIEQQQQDDGGLEGLMQLLESGKLVEAGQMGRDKFLSVVGQLLEAAPANWSMLAVAQFLRSLGSQSAEQIPM